MTPFEAVYGRPSSTLLHYIQGETLIESVTEELKDRDEALKQLKFNLQKAQASMCKFANKRRNDVSFQSDEWVYLKLRPHV